MPSTEDTAVKAEAWTDDEATRGEAAMVGRLSNDVRHKARQADCRQVRADGRVKCLGSGMEDQFMGMTFSV
jgi:hypothetical protein